MDSHPHISQEIRRNFLNYFKKQGHSAIPSSPVVPHNDPTLLFINAGMNQFKDTFLGKGVRDYSRAATCQKCIRAGGKHNDLENVGHTSRHMTFFEMLGNFSFGDYFKEDAIRFAWEVSTEVFGLDGDRIRATVFREDDEAAELWKKYLPASKIFRFDEKDNFWAMGDTGPCGPCSELLYDRGNRFGDAKTPLEDKTGERFLEYWNLVFMQYNRDAKGQLENLPKQSIDTGAGLERIVSLRMGVSTLFATDILRSLIAQIEHVSGVPYQGESALNAPPFHVIADHLRCLAFAIADGAQPSNMDRGYVLRKILRRAVRYGKQIGFEEPFLAKILPRLVETMGDDYGELKEAESRIAEILTVEEESFFRTLKRGGNLLSQIISSAETSAHCISGDDAFKLKDTYGLPLDEILLLAKDSELTVDLERYKTLEEEARDRSRSTQKTVQHAVSENAYAENLQEHGESLFIGYNHHTAEAIVTGIFSDGKPVERLDVNQKGMVILDRTPFYAEKGGQVGDTGTLLSEKSRFEVENCLVPYAGVIAHEGILQEGSIKLGDNVTALIDKDRRQRIANNHTATHLLHWALQKILGDHIRQAGSIVDPERLRFDFSHHKALSVQEIRAIEDLVNAKIRENHHVEWYEIPYEEAQKKKEIKQFFGDKYGTKVRVVDIEYSKELCGGTHTDYVGNIGYFRIVKEGSISAGVRRIEAVSGAAAEAYGRQFEDIIDTAALALKIPPASLTERILKLVDENKALAAELKKMRKSQLSELSQSLMAEKKTINGIPYIAVQTAIEAEDMKSFADEAMAKLGSGVLVLGLAKEDSCSVIAKVSSDLNQKGIKANELIKAISPIIEGSGGGRPDSAQAGGKAPKRLPEALAQVGEWLKNY